MAIDGQVSVIKGPMTIEGSVPKAVLRLTHIDGGVLVIADRYTDAHFWVFFEIHELSNLILFDLGFVLNSSKLCKGVTTRDGNGHIHRSNFDLPYTKF